MANNPETEVAVPTSQEYLTLKALLSDAWSAAVLAEVSNADMSGDGVVKVSAQDIIRRTTAFQALEAIGRVSTVSFFVPAALCPLIKAMSENASSMLYVAMGVVSWSEATLGDAHPDRSFTDEVETLVMKSIQRNTASAKIARYLQDEASAGDIEQTVFKSEAYNAIMGDIAIPDDVAHDLAVYMPWVFMAYLTNLWYLEIVTNTVTWVASTIAPKK